MAGVPPEGTTRPLNPEQEQKLQGPSRLERGVDEKCLTGAWTKPHRATSVQEWSGPMHQRKLEEIEKGSVACRPELGTSRSAHLQSSQVSLWTRMEHQEPVSMGTGAS